MDGVDMKILVLGSGQMGKGTAFDLVRNDTVEQVIVADIDGKRAEAVTKELGPKAVAEQIDAKDRGQLETLFSKVDSVVSCISYTVNLLHTEVAIATGTHLCDLGGNLKVVQQQLEINEQAKSADVIIVPDCGLAPGMVSVFARDGIEYLDRVENVKIRVGGLQQEPRPPLNYALIFSVEGLINEYIERVLCYKDPLPISISFNYLRLFEDA